MNSMPLKKPKNKYYQGCKISESDFEEIARLFFKDFSTKEIIELEKFQYDRKTIYDVILKIRERIHVWMSKENYAENWIMELYEELTVNIGRGLVKFKNDSKPIKAYFLFEINNNLYTHPLKQATAHHLRSISGVIRNTDILKRTPLNLIGIYDYTNSKYRKILRVDSAENFNSKVHERLKKEFGFRYGKFRLILSESEFKNNTEDPLKTLLKRLKTNPLTKRL